MNSKHAPMRIALKILVFLLAVGLYGFISHGKDQEESHNDAKAISLIKIFSLSGDDAKAIGEVIVRGYAKDYGEDGFFLFMSTDHAKLRIFENGILIERSRNAKPGFQVQSGSWVELRGTVRIIGQFDFPNQFDIPVIQVVDAKEILEISEDQ